MRSLRRIEVARMPPYRSSDSKREQGRGRCDCKLRTSQDTSADGVKDGALFLRHEGRRSIRPDAARNTQSDQEQKRHPSHSCTDLHAEWTKLETYHVSSGFDSRSDERIVGMQQVGRDTVHRDAPTGIEDLTDDENAGSRVIDVQTETVGAILYF